MNLEDFGGPANPLRCSKLDTVVKCPISVVLSMGEAEDEGGKAAQTGSLAHLAVAAFHLEPDLQRKVQAGLAALRDGLPRFPHGDPEDATRHFQGYAGDPRNLNAIIARDAAGSPVVERKVSISLPPHPSDPTGQPIYIHGTLDQIRLTERGPGVCDLKTGAKSGWEMIHDYAYQQSAYVVAARASGFPDAVPGQIIRTGGYRTRTAKGVSPDGVFWAMPWTVDDCWMILDRLRLAVAQIRAGEVGFGPGPQCTYCKHGGLQECVPTAKHRLSLEVV